MPIQKTLNTRLVPCGTVAPREVLRVIALNLINGREDLDVLKFFVVFAVAWTQADNRPGWSSVTS